MSRPTGAVVVTAVLVLGALIGGCLGEADDDASPGDTTDVRVEVAADWLG